MSERALIWETSYQEFHACLCGRPWPMLPAPEHQPTPERPVIEIRCEGEGCGRLLSRLELLPESRWPYTPRKLGIVRSVS